MGKGVKNTDKDGLISWEKGGLAYTLCKVMLQKGELDKNKLPLQVCDTNKIFDRLIKNHSGQVGPASKRNWVSIDASHKQ